MTSIRFPLTRSGRDYWSDPEQRGDAEQPSRAETRELLEMTEFEDRLSIRPELIEAGLI